MKKDITIMDLAQDRYNYILESTSDAFKALFSMMSDLDDELGKYLENDSLNADDFLSLSSLYKRTSCAMVFLDCMLSDISDNYSWISLLPRLKDLGKKEKKEIKDLKEEIQDRTESFISSCDEMVEYFMEKDFDDLSPDKASSIIEILNTVFANLENILYSYEDTAIWSDPEYSDFYMEEDQETDGMTP